MAVAAIFTHPRPRRASRSLAILELMPLFATSLYAASGYHDAFFWLGFAVGLGWLLAGRPVFAIGYALVHGLLYLYLQWIALPTAFGAVVGYATCTDKADLCRSTTPLIVTTIAWGIVHTLVPVASAVILALRPPVRRWE